MSDVSAVAAPDPTTGSRLPELIALAHESSSESRRALLRELTDHFFGTSVRSGAEDQLYGEVLSDLSAEMETAVRAELGLRFASRSDAPRSLIRRLAADQEVEVAGEILRQSPMLSDQDLLDVARIRGQEHLRAISGRED